MDDDEDFEGMEDIEDLDEDEYGTDEEYDSWGDDDEAMNDVENVEFPVSNEEFPVSILDFRETWPASETWPGRRSEVRSDFHLMLYLVGEELGDGGSTSAAGTGLNSVVCLPESLVEEVLLWLPAAAQARCRAVCKAWLAIIAKPEFLRRSFLQALSRTTMPPLCAVRWFPERQRSRRRSERMGQVPRSERMGQVLPPFKALKVDLSFLPGVFQSCDAELHVSSACGLMCISRRVREGMLVCVLNPVNQSLKVLPLLQKLWGFDVVLLMGRVSATESTPSFRVYVSGVQRAPCSESPLCKDFAIYSSISGEWKGILGGPDVVVSEDQAVACNGDLYATVDYAPPRLVRVSTETGPRYLWDIPLPRFDRRVAGPPDFERVPWKDEFFLAMHRGRLLCCCGGIWMLDDDKKLWVEIAGRCPPDIILPGNRWPVWQGVMLKSVHVAGDLVVFFYQLGAGRGHQNLDCPVAYDMLAGCWLQVAPCIAQAGDVFQPMPNLRL